MVDPQALDLHDPTRTAWHGGGPRPVPTLVWRPASDDRRARPLVVVSHGSGGSPQDLAWLAESLSAQGFLVAAVRHHGNNNDENLPEGMSFWWERAPDLSVVVDHLERTESLASVGVVGYSLGGYAAAAVLGARIDTRKLERLYAGEPVLPIPPGRPDIAAEVAGLLAEHGGRDAVTARAVADYRDSRFGAGVLLAPAICPILDDTSLAAVRRPVLVRWGDADEVEAPEDNGRRYTRLIPGADGRSMGEQVGHFAFGDGDQGGTPVRETVAAEALAFFGSHLV
ncbi:Predicted dienelactone hydrolase [Actinopolymorpha cephalotaxi]|uniref:Dienelactone hydrolase n=1 Tax=Actinopolymorpha cephalotaxi TaxID=504797 RepID=A0A1I2PD13_9ACTN|nr:alpha/beta hydrolase [Actinopolymorpha cephalotaxi]NYH83689.1 putative dienelactone hydrolase [Actinopolymorpha cephalotaxi]SFG12999.1 Predicted dienelactone hydrolase [Actinopolymorpha cephalotaxi]